MATANSVLKNIKSSFAAHSLPVQCMLNQTLEEDRLRLEEFVSDHSYGVESIRLK